MTASKPFPENVLKLLKIVAEEQAVKDFRIEKLGDWQKGENYLGEVTPARIIGKNKSLEIIVKSAFGSEALRNHAPIDVVYEREVFFYKTLIPLWKQFESMKGIPKPLPYVTECLKSSLDKNQEVLVLKNLKPEGFQTANRRKSLNFEHVKMVLETYGKWHGLSYAYRHQHFEKYMIVYEKIKYDVGDTFFVNFEAHKALLKEWTQIQDAFDPEKDQKYIGALKKLCEDVNQIRDGIYDLDKYSVFLHGDGWTNNFLFKYENENDKTKPKELCLIDFQMLRVGSPVTDLAYFLYTCTSKEIFNNLKDCLKIYHNSLAEHLEKLGGNIDEALPFTVLEQQWKKYAKVGFMSAFFLIKIMLTENSEAVSLQEVEDFESLKTAFDYEITNAEEVKSRLMDVVRHFVDNNFL